MTNEVKTMLKECKLALAITATAYDGELCSLMDAGARDLEIAGITLPGTVDFQMTNQGIVDASTRTDALVMRAIFTYVRMYFRQPDNYNQLLEAYQTQKVQLMHATGYTDYGEEDDGDGES